MNKAWFMFWLLLKALRKDIVKINHRTVPYEKQIEMISTTYSRYHGLKCKIYLFYSY